MYQFYFNDCIPNNASEFSLTECLKKTLTEYNEVRKSYPEHIDGIVTSASILNFILNTKNFSLKNYIDSMKNKDLRTFAYSIFTKHPIADYYSELNEIDLIEKDYSITIAGTSYNAINSVIVSENNGVLFTLALHDDLKKNKLTVCSNTNTTVDVNNLFGFAENTTYIKELVKQSITEKLGNFEKLLELVGENSYSSRFASGFQDASSNVQISILEHIQKAIARKESSKFFSDGNLIKDVTPEKFSYRIFELRIFKPVAYRVYFYEADTKTYLALIEKKPPQKKQDNHINAATSIIEQLILIEQ